MVATPRQASAGAGNHGGQAMLHLVQLRNADGSRAVAAVTEAGAHLVPGVASTYELANAAIAGGRTLAAQVAAAGRGEPVDLDAALAGGRVLAPIDHRDPAHLLVTGTGLSHLGSAEGRDKMHKDLSDPSKLTELHEDLPHGPGGRQAEAGRAGRPAGVVLQGRRLHRRRPRTRRCSRPISRSTAAKSRSWSAST